MIWISFERGVSSFLDVLPIATKSDVERIDRKVSALGRKLKEMEKGNLAVTVFQDAKGQGKAVVDSAVKLKKGEKFESPYVYIPFQLVTQENYKEFLNK